MNRLIKFLSISLNTLGTQVLMFIGISLMAKSQGVEFIGYQSLVFSIASYLLLIVQLGFQTQGLKLIVEGFNFRSLFIKFTMIKISIFLIILTLMFTLLLYYRSDNIIGVLILFLIGGFGLINSEYYLQYKERFFLIGFSRLLSGLVFFSVCIYIYEKDNVEIGSLLSVLPYAFFLFMPQLFLIFFYKNEIKKSHGRDFVIDSTIIKQSAIIALGALVVQFGYRADKILISNFLGIYDLGLYDTAYKFLNVALNLAFILYFVVAKNIKIKTVEYYHKTILVFVLCAVLGGSVLYFLSPLLVTMFFGENFKESILILRLLIIPLIFMVMNIAMISPMNLFSMEKYYLILVVFSTTVNLIVNLIFIDFFGVYGAVYAMVTSEILMSIVFVLFFYRKLKVKIDINRREG